MTAVAKPFLKWAGGKRQLLAAYEPYLPSTFNEYYEPFVGGGAMFFHLRATRPPFTAYLSDSNFELMTTYEQVRDNVGRVIDILMFLASSDNEHFYISVRDADPVSESAIAARMIYLNHTCFNGLYRVNKDGKFNVPYGHPKKNPICDEVTLRAVAEELKDVDLHRCDFTEFFMSDVMPSAGDFIYFDPPYDSPDSRKVFTAYSPDGFTQADQYDLATLFTVLAKRGCRCLLSNSDTHRVRELYADHEIIPIQARRAINNKGTGRGSVAEVLIRNYK